MDRYFKSDFENASSIHFFIKSYTLQYVHRHAWNGKERMFTKASTVKT